MSQPKDRIFDAALARVTESGAASLSMRTLAEAVGMSPMGLYRHFPNREALLQALIDHGFEELKVELSRPLKARRPLDRLIERWDRAVAFGLSRPPLFELIFLAPGMPVRQFPRDFKGASSPTFPLFVADVRECMEARVLRRDDADEVAFLLWAQVHGLLVFALRGRLASGPVGLKRRVHANLARMLAGLAP